MQIGRGLRSIYIGLPTNSATFLSPKFKHVSSVSALVAMVGLCACLQYTDAVRAQANSFSVIVGDQTYLVTGDFVSRKSGPEAPDAETAAKARFAARVVDDQILNSKLNKELFNVINRAIVMRDRSSMRLVEPWRRLLRSTPLDAGGSDDRQAAVLGDAKNAFKTWAVKLSTDQRELTLAVIRMDYLDSIPAYLDNVAVYRNVINQKQVLTYDGALRFMRNQVMVTRLAIARSAEEQLNQGTPSTPKETAVNPTNVDRLRQRLENEVIDRIDAAQTLDDLEANNKKIREIANSDLFAAQNHSLNVYLQTLVQVSIAFELWASTYGPGRLQ
jgi:hypothetical protein